MTITTDVTLSIPGGDPRPGILVLPEQTPDGGAPGVVVIHDITGMREDTKRHCRRFAEAGYAAIAPDLYDGGQPRCVVRTVMSMLTERGEALDVIDAARSMLAARDEVDASRIAVTGFCMGGGFAVLAAADGAYAAAAPFYGTAPRSSSRIKGICPTLGQFGDMDKLFAMQGKRLERQLQKLGVEHEVVIYPGVGHSFMNDHEDALWPLARHTPLVAFYDEATESMAWARMMSFFSQHMPAR